MKVLSTHDVGENPDVLAFVPGGTYAQVFHFPKVSLEKRRLRSEILGLLEVAQSGPLWSRQSARRLRLKTGDLCSPRTRLSNDLLHAS
jgi:hypothetical protein